MTTSQLPRRLTQRTTRLILFGFILVALGLGLAYSTTLPNGAPTCDARPDASCITLCDVPEHTEHHDAVPCH